jgi:hypothetical protein
MSPAIDRRAEGLLDVLPSRLARDCFDAWRHARHGNPLPALKDFAPLALPAAALPWLLIHRLRADGALVYGLAGEELVQLFGANPKGKPVLGDCDGDEREKRLGLVRRSIASGLPFWFGGSLLLENKEHLPIGRVCLPARDGADRVLVLIYVILHDAPVPRLRVVGASNIEPAQIVWCRESDLIG